MANRMLFTFLAFLAVVSASAQGTINFNNRNIQGAAGPYNVLFLGDTAGAVAQLFLVGASSTFTPVEGQATFRTTVGQTWAFQDPVLAVVPGVAPGQNATLVLRAWKGTSFNAALAAGNYWVQSPFFTVGPLGGEDPNGGLPFLPPDLAGPNGVGGIPPLQLYPFPEPSTYAIAALGAMLLLARRRK